MEQIELQRAIEAILFAAGEPVEISQLSHVLETDEKDIISAADALSDELNDTNEKVAELYYISVLDLMASQLAP